jgi:hypothetical protein
MAELDQATAGSRVSNLDPFTLERSSLAPDTDSVVYPMWLGANCKPTVQGDGFTGERRDRITRGRVEGYVPEVEFTGTGFWRRLLRFDLRDDRLRLQHLEWQERDGVLQLALARQRGGLPGG